MSAVLIASHATAASLAMALGGWQLWRSHKGGSAHRLVGRVWVVTMYWTVLSSFFIKRLDPGHFSWLHGLSLFTFCTLTIGLVAAVRGDIKRHRAFMTGSYYGLLGAVVVPQRDIPQLALHRPLVLALTALGVLVLAAATITLCQRAERSPHHVVSSSSPLPEMDPVAETSQAV